MQPQPFTIGTPMVPMVQYPAPLVHAPMPAQQYPSPTAPQEYYQQASPQQHFPLQQGLAAQPPMMMNYK